MPGAIAADEMDDEDRPRSRQRGEDPRVVRRREWYAVARAAVVGLTSSGLSETVTTKAIAEAAAQIATGVLSRCPY